MKLLNILTLSLILTSCASKKDGPKVLWEQSTFKNPESAYFYPKTKHIYVSNVAGSPVAKDNDGWISKLDKDGKVIAPKWIMGLHAPKGLRANGDNLYVSDIDSLVIISIKQGKILKKIKVKGAKFLNDVAIDDKGNVYVSDMFTNKVHIYRNGKVKTFLNYKQLLKSSPNGLLVDANKLLVATWGKGLNKKDFSTKEAGRIISYDLKTKKLLTQTAPIGSLDGLERLD